MDLLSMLDLPPDDWCDKYIQDGNYLKTADAVWGVRSSVLTGLALRHVVALRAGEPYLPLWPWHWRLILDELPRIGVSEIEFPTSKDLRDEIWLLATRNRYPANSLAHIVVWQEKLSGGYSLRHAIFQSRRPRPLFDYDPRRSLRLSAPTPLSVVGGNSGVWAEGPIEALAQRNAEDEGLDGACLALENGNLARASIGNIFFLLRGGRVVGSSRGAKPDALCEFAKDSGIWDKFPFHYEEMEGIPQNIVFEAEECFVCDSALGVQPVVSVGTQKRFLRTISARFAEELRSLTSL
ncbi:MAG: hypothetical protein II375_06435 [Bacteroidales bacterium]|nr:hypothetical protein [Bacteroidales bacterium]